MIRRYLVLIGCVALTTLFARESSAQAPAGARVVRGRVLDASRKPISDVTVEGSDTAGHRVAAAKSDSTGTFVLRGFAKGILYVFSARRIGYVRSVTPAAVIASDTLNVEFVLAPARVTLSTVEVTAPSTPDYRLSAADIAARHDDVSDIGGFLDRWKPRMLGDEWKQCKTMKPTSAQSGSSRYRRSAQFHDADSLKIYINGVNAAPWDLDEIHARDVLEARYFDCHEKDPLLRNALVIVLKPGATP